MMQRQKTRKLFYNKWPIKIECVLKKSGTIARVGVNETLAWVNGDSANSLNSWYWRDANKSDISEFALAFRPYENQEIRVRGEGSHFNIFVKDTALSEKIIKSMEKWVSIITEPSSAEEFDFLIGHNKKVICNTLPKGQYQYKIYLKTKMSIDNRKKFLEWLSRYGDSYDIATNTSKWLNHEKHWIQDPFFYAKNQHSLSMCGLYLGNNVSKIEEFIPRSKINTSCPI
jgi:hypothetical protein